MFTLPFCPIDFSDSQMRGEQRKKQEREEEKKKKKKKERIGVKGKIRYISSGIERNARRERQT